MSLFSNYNNICIALITGLIIIVVYLSKQFLIKKSVKKPNKSVNKVKPQTKVKETVTKAKKKSSVNERWLNRDTKKSYSHPWLITSFKGHTGEVLDIDYSSNGKYLASCSEDRSVLLWYINDITSQKKDHKSLRINIDFDHAIFVKWCPNSKSLFVHKHIGNNIEVYKIDKRKDGTLIGANKTLTFQKISDDDVIGMVVASTGRFLMTCTTKNILTIWDMRGKILSTLDTCLMTTHSAKVSPCGKFVAACGFSPDCKIWEVIFNNRTGEFQGVKRAFELSGHTSGIFDIAFTASTSHIATVSKDGTWKVYNIAIEYHKGEDPHLITTGRYDYKNQKPLIAISPNADVVVISIGSSLLFFNVFTSNLDTSIDNIFGGNITQLFFDPSGKYIFVSGDKIILTIHNVTGYRTEIVDAKNKLKQRNLTSATKDRLQNLIETNQAFLNNLNEHYTV